jgi:hypothetical protein
MSGILIAGNTNWLSRKNAWNLSEIRKFLLLCSFFYRLWWVTSLVKTQGNSKLISIDYFSASVKTKIWYITSVFWTFSRFGLFNVFVWSNLHQWLSFQFFIPKFSFIASCIVGKYSRLNRSDYGRKLGWAKLNGKGYSLMVFSPPCWRKSLLTWQHIQFT